MTYKILEERESTSLKDCRLSWASPRTGIYAESSFLLFRSQDGKAQWICQVLAKWWGGFGPVDTLTSKHDCGVLVVGGTNGC
jgi:hypothetical protein